MNKTNRVIHRFLIGQIESLLAEVLKFTAPADHMLSQFFREHRKLGQHDRQLIAETVYAILRRKSEYSHLAESGTGTHYRRLTLLGLMQVVGRQALKPVITEDEGKWLSHISQIDPAHLPFEVRLNLPEWLIQALRAQMSEEELLAFAMSIQYPAPLDVRTNILKTTRAQLLEDLVAQGIQAEATPYSPFGIRVEQKPALFKLPIFEQGYFEIQDEGSQLIAHVVAPKRGEMIVDFCAGAGGKTLAMGAMMRSTGRVYALDVSEKRLSRFKPRLARSGLSNVFPIVIQHESDTKIKRLTNKIDRVLLDVPCSGLGTLRRNPDLKWRQTPESIAEIRQKQQSILDNAARLVKSGGQLIYATCSLLNSENQEMVAQFLHKNQDFILKPVQTVLDKQEIALDTGEYLSLWPHRHHTDGFFAAILERK